MEIENIQKLENATSFGRKKMFRFGSALLFIVGIMLFSSAIHPAGEPVSIELVIAAMIGGYMAMNIGANDVANNVGPAVGSRALTLSGAIVIAAIFEAAGALIAGGGVVSTIKNGIIDSSLIPNAEVKKHTAKAEFTKRERKGLKKVYRQELVKRSALLKIAAAWVITVPAAGIMAALLFFTIRGMMLP